jgi:cytochrome-b5 reductase
VHPLPLLPGPGLGMPSSGTFRPILSVLGLAVLGPISTSFAKAEGGQQDLKAFSPTEFRAFPIGRIEMISPNTKLFELALPSPEYEMGMQTASFVLVKGPNDEQGNAVTRPYTPTSINKEKGHCQLVIKAYPAGKVSTYLHSLKVGDNIELKGPLMKFKYEPNMKRRIGMIAGGTGITPMIQVLREIVNNPEDKTEVHIVFANNTEDDILLRGLLEKIVKDHHDQVKLTYILSQPSPTWKGHCGFISAGLLKETMPKPAEDTLVLVCGPPGFMDAVSGNKTRDFKQGALSGILKELGYTENMVFKF